MLRSAALVVFLVVTGTTTSARADDTIRSELRLLTEFGGGAVGFAAPALFCGAVIDPASDDFATTGVALYACAILSAVGAGVGTYLGGELAGGDSRFGWSLMGSSVGMVGGTLLAIPFGLFDILSGEKQDTALAILTLAIVGVASVAGGMVAYELSNGAP
ncbi:MAG: hypothetical protein R3A78_08430 [Polyangiales bacterium]